MRTKLSKKIRSKETRNKKLQLLQLVKVVAKEEGRDVVRRQEHNDRGEIALEISMVNPVLEKVEIFANAKQFRILRIVLEKLW